MTAKKKVTGRVAKKKALRPGPKGAITDATYMIGMVLNPTVDAYSDIPGTLFDSGKLGLRLLGYHFAGLVASITAKVVGSIDGINFFDLTGADAAGVARPIDVVVGIGAFIPVVFTPFLAPGAAAGAFRFYKAQAKSTGAGVPGNVTCSIVAKH